MRNVCSRLFGIFFPKKRKGMPEHLGKLVKMLDTPEDLTLLSKRSSTEIGANETMALAMSHGEKVDSDKVSSSMAKDDGRNDVSIKAFLEEAKKYSSQMMALILLDDAPSATAMPSSSATPAAATTHAEVS
jgi:hypothetical protein